MHHDAVPPIDMVAILVLLVLMVASSVRTWRAPGLPANRAIIRSTPVTAARRHAHGPAMAVRSRSSALPPLPLLDLPSQRGEGPQPSFAGPETRPRAARARTEAAPRASRRTHRKRVPWYHRKLVVGPVVAVALFTMVVSGGAWYAASQLATLDDISTPPPEISGEFLEGNADSVIDTRPAQEHVQEQSELVETPASTPVEPGTLTVLMMGVDAEPGQPIDIQVRADSLSVVHVNPELGICRMLSIPRDTRVELPGYGYSKINHALAIGGIPYQQLVVEQYLGISIDHYGLIDFSGMSRIVDAVGGVTVENEDQEFSIGEFTYPTGTLHLNGDQAVLYARYRGGPDGDYGRQKRQQQVARALLANGADLNLITAIPDVLSTVRGHIRTDINARALRDLAQEHRSTCTAESLETASIAGTVAYDWDDLSGQELMFVHIEEEEVETRLSWLLGNSDARDSTGTDPVERHGVGPASLTGRYGARGTSGMRVARARRHAVPAGVSPIGRDIGQTFGVIARSRRRIGRHGER